MQFEITKLSIAPDSLISIQIKIITCTADYKE